MSNDEN